MTETYNSINFNINEKVAVAIMQGYDFFDGTDNSRSTQYIGFAFTYSFLKNQSVNKQKKKAAIETDS